MAKLEDLAKVLRSKNAGPFHLTLDVMFDDSKVYNRVKASGLIDKRHIAELYRLDSADQVEIIEHDLTKTIKVTIPRLTSSGSPNDSDVLGCQQHAPLLDLEMVN